MAGSAEGVDIAALLSFEQQLRMAEDRTQLAHTIVNQAHTCLPYMQAVLLSLRGRRLEALAASDIPTVDHTAPFFTWVEGLAQYVDDQADQGVQILSTADVSDELAAQWNSLTSAHLLWIPLHHPAAGDTAEAVLLLSRADRWSDDDKQLAEHLSGSIGHALFALRRCHWSGLFWSALRQRRAVALLMVALFATMWLPVRLSAVAPVEVIARDPHVVSAPIDGAVREVLVMPNQLVQAGDLLVQLEDSELASAHEVAERALLVARAELKTVQQGGFVDATQKARLAELESTVRLRAAEVEQAAQRLRKTQIRAATDGVVVLSDRNEWKGRPVRVGERIMLLADAKRVELNIMLPVKDSIALRQDAEVAVFFDNNPLQARHGNVVRAGYEPQRTPDDQIAYRLSAHLDEDAMPPPRIGLRGTARVYGDSVHLFFYLFRRPITAVRQYLGW